MEPDEPQAAQVITDHRHVVHPGHSLLGKEHVKRVFRRADRIIAFDPRASSPLTYRGTAYRPVRDGHRPPGTWPWCGCGHRNHLIGGTGLAGCQAAAAGWAARAEPGCPGVIRIVAIRFRRAVSLQVVFAEMQVEQCPVRKTEPAKRAGRDKRAGHVILLGCLSPNESRPGWTPDAFGVGTRWRQPGITLRHPNGRHRARAIARREAAPTASIARRSCGGSPAALARTAVASFSPAFSPNSVTKAPVQGIWRLPGGQRSWLLRLRR